MMTGGAEVATGAAVAFVVVQVHLATLRTRRHISITIAAVAGAGRCGARPETAELTARTGVSAGPAVRRIIRDAGLTAV